jgi:hypothetical protein
VAVELLAIGRGNIARGTNAGNTAAIAGIWKARAAPTASI